MITCIRENIMRSLAVLGGLGKGAWGLARRGAGVKCQHIAVINQRQYFNQIRILRSLANAQFKNRHVWAYMYLLRNGYTLFMPIKETRNS